MPDYAYRLDAVPADDAGLYAHLPLAEEEVELIHSLLPGPSTILDLGSGRGRIATPLANLGHHLTAVDCSPRMLSSLKGMETICTRIEMLRLPRVFDAVLLASHLVNAAEPSLRMEFLRTIKRHLARDGQAFVQCMSEDGVRGMRPGMVSQYGELSMTVRRAKCRNGQFDLRLEYENPHGRWLERARGDLLDDAALRDTFAQAGLHVFEQHGAEGEWLVLRHAAVPAVAA